MPPSEEVEAFVELGIITDEVSQDFTEACEHIARWGLQFAELRNVDGTNIVQLTDVEADAAKATLDRLGLRVSAIASPVFKSPLDESEAGGAVEFSVAGAVSVAAQLRLLERACRLAKRFDTPLVRVFTFLRVPWSEAVVDEIVGHMAAAAEIAASHGVVLAVENEPACVVGTGEELGLFFARLDDALGPDLRGSVGALWDPGNALAIGEELPYPDGYAAVPAARLVHVHLKDLAAERASFGTFVPLGQGRIDYRGQFRALVRDGYSGSLVLEPHYSRPGLSSVQAAEQCVAALRAELAAAGV